MPQGPGEIAYQGPNGEEAYGLPGLTLPEGWRAVEEQTQPRDEAPPNPLAAMLGIIGPKKLKQKVADMGTFESSIQPENLPGTLARGVSEGTRGAGALAGTVVGSRFGIPGAMAGAGAGSVLEDLLRGESVDVPRAGLSAALTAAPGAAAKGINALSRYRPPFMGKTGDATRMADAIGKVIPPLGPDVGPLPSGAKGPSSLMDIAGAPGKQRLSAFLGTERDAMAAELPTIGGYPPKPFLPRIPMSSGVTPPTPQVRDYRVPHPPTGDPPSLAGEPVALAGKPVAPPRPQSQMYPATGPPADPQARFKELLNELAVANKASTGAQGAARDNVTGFLAGREASAIRADIIKLLEKENPQLIGRFNASQQTYGQGAEVRRSLQSPKVLGTKGFDQGAMQSVVDQRLKKGGTYDPAILDTLYRGGKPPLGDRPLQLPIPVTRGGRIPLGTYKSGPGANLEMDPLMRLLGPLLQAMQRQGQ